MQTPIVIALAASVAFGFVVFAWLLLGGVRRRPQAEAVSTDVADASVGPVQRTTFAESLLAAAPRGYTGWIDRQILFAGRPFGWSVTKVLVWKIVLGVLALLLALLVVRFAPQPVIVAIAFGAVVLAFFLPDVFINGRAHDRQQAIQKALPDTLDQMTIAVEAGLGFDGAMAKAGQNGRGPLSEELIRVLQDMSIGRTRRDAYRALEQRTNCEDLRRFVRAVIQADAYGVAIADVLRVQAGEMRIKRRQRAEEQAMKVTVKIIFPLVFCLLPVLFIVVMTPGVINIINGFSN